MYTSYPQGSSFPQPRKGGLWWVPLGWGWNWTSGSTTQGLRWGQTGGNRCLRCTRWESVCVHNHPSIPTSTEDSPGNPRMRAPLFSKGKLPAPLMTRFWLPCGPMKLCWSQSLLLLIKQPRQCRALTSREVLPNQLPFTVSFLVMLQSNVDIENSRWLGFMFIKALYISYPGNSSVN